MADARDVAGIYLEIFWTIHHIVWTTEAVLGSLPVAHK